MGFHETWFSNIIPPTFDSSSELPIRSCNDVIVRNIEIKIYCDLPVTYYFMEVGHLDTWCFNSFNSKYTEFSQTDTCFCNPELLDACTDDIRWLEDPLKAKLGKSQMTRFHGIFGLVEQMNELMMFHL